tara:strand:+ start:290 stop:550 length:261 start_codon:yes stop_codon:yes gene_type:complete
MKIAKLHRYFDVEGNYHGPEDHKIHVDGVEYDMYQYAKEHGIELPDAKKSKKKINKDIEEKHGDMESSQHSGDTEEHGDGNSESTE